MRTRPAVAGDLAAITDILMEDAAARTAHDGALWPTAEDAAARIAGAFAEEAPAAGTMRWLVAERGGAVEGVARFGLIPCPPIYHLAGRHAFLLFEDTAASGRDEADALAALVEAAGREGEAMGAAIFLAAAAPFQHAKTRALERAGYGAVTHYLVKHGLAPGPAPAAVRTATAADVPAIVAMGARSQKALARAHAGMWTPHPDAQARFGLWMQHALTLTDRRILVASGGAGFVVAQPPSPFHVPLTARRDRLGLIDDFWSDAFESDPRVAADLLAAAEREFAQRGRTSAVAICPAVPQPKRSALHAAGYRLADAWLTKTS